jgi:ribulose kinase
MGAENMNVLAAGVPVGQGLSKQAAEELGLVEGTAVGSGLIDAYVSPLSVTTYSIDTINIVMQVG